MQILLPILISNFPVQQPGSLQLAVADGSWERNHIADITHSGQIHDAALKTEPKACMARRAVFSQIQIKIIILRLKPELTHAGKQNPSPSGLR